MSGLDESSFVCPLCEKKPSKFILVNVGLIIVPVYSFDTITSTVTRYRYGHSEVNAVLCDGCRSIIKYEEHTSFVNRLLRACNK